MSFNEAFELTTRFEEDRDAYREAQRLLFDEGDTGIEVFDRYISSQRRYYLHLARLAGNIALIVNVGMSDVQPPQERYAEWALRLGLVERGTYQNEKALYAAHSALAGQSLAQSTEKIIAEAQESGEIDAHNLEGLTNELNAARHRASCLFSVAANCMSAPFAYPQPKQ